MDKNMIKNKKELKELIDSKKEIILNLSKAQTEIYNELCEDLNIDIESESADYLFDYVFNEFDYNYEKIFFKGK